MSEARIILRPIGTPLPLGAALALLVPVVAGAAKAVAAAVMGLAALRFATTGAAELTGSATWLSTAGIVGLVLGAVALYAALGFELEDARHRTVLPLLRRGAAAAAMHGADGSPVDREAGVREQL